MVALLSLASQALPAPLTASRNSALVVPTATIAATHRSVTSVSAETQQGGTASLTASERWVRSYSPAGAPNSADAYAMAVREDGSVIVTGSAYFDIGEQADIATICYSAEGVALWTNRYDGPAHQYDNPSGVAAGPSGDVLVVGVSRREAFRISSDVVVLKYASNGVPVWTNLYSSFGTNSSSAGPMVLDREGNCYLMDHGTAWGNSGTGTVLGEAITKFGPGGSVVWRKIYSAQAPDSGQGLHRAAAMALDPDGNLLVVGESGQPHYTSGRVVVKFSGDGTPVWTNFHPGWSLRYTAVAADHAGSAIVTAEDWAGGQMVYDVIKFSSMGVLLWTNRVFGAVYQGGGVPKALIDQAGNIVLQGGASGSTRLGLYDIYKFSATGTRLWTNQSVYLGRTNAYATVDAIDVFGSFYMMGSGPVAGQDGGDYVVGKYSPAGTILWTRVHGGEGTSDDFPRATRVSSDGAVYVTGSSGGRFATVKYVDAIRYAPPQDYIGVDTVTYTMADLLGDGSSDSMEVTVTPGHFHLVPTALRRSPAGMHIRVDGLPHPNPVLLSVSRDLISWRPLMTNSPNGNTVEFIDTASDTPRFYQASQEP